MKKVLGFLVLSIALIAVGFFLCDSELGEKIKAFVDPIKTFCSEVVDVIKNEQLCRS